MGVTNPLFSFFFFLYIIKINVPVRLHALAVFTNSKLNDYINF